MILDSNFLFIPLSFKVDIFEEFKRLLGRPVACIIPSPVIDELHILKRDAAPSFRKEIDFALKITCRCEVVKENVMIGETVDEVIIRMAESIKCPVATNDAVLRRRLREKGIPVIYLRQQAFLEIDGFI